MSNKATVPAKAAAPAGVSKQPKPKTAAVAPKKSAAPKGPKPTTSAAPSKGTAPMVLASAHDNNSNVGGGVSRGGHSGASSPATATMRFANGLSATEQERSLSQWIDTVLNPEGDVVTDVPVIMEAAGNPITKCYRVQMKGTAIANASGFAFVGLCLDAWVADPTQAYDVPLGRYLGTGGNGAPVTYTNASYVGTSSPDYNIGTATAGVLQVLVPGTNYSGIVPNGGTQTAYRLVGAKLSVWVDGSNQTVQGKVALVRVDSPEMAVKVPSYTGPLPLVGVPYATVSGYDPNLISMVELACPNWPTAQEASIVGLPLNETPFYMWNPINGNAYSNATGNPSIAAFVSGAAVNQPLEFRVTLVYAAQMPVSYEANADEQAFSMYYSSMGHIQETLANMYHHYSELTPVQSSGGGSSKPPGMGANGYIYLNPAEAAQQSPNSLGGHLRANSESQRSHKARRSALALAGGSVSTPLGMRLGAPETHKIERVVRREIANGGNEKSIFRRIWEFVKEYGPAAIGVAKTLVSLLI